MSFKGRGERGCARCICRLDKPFALPLLHRVGENGGEGGGKRPTRERKGKRGGVHLFFLTVIALLGDRCG